MSRLAKIIIASISVIAVVSTACTSKEGGESLADETHLTAGPKGYAALIRRTTDGVPHIIADDFKSVVFGQGYASAQDHPCDLVDQIIMVNSGRSAIFGPGEKDANLKSDFGWGALGIVKIAQKEFAEFEGEELEAFEGYAEGWNAYYDKVGADGIQDWCTGADWMKPITAEDLYSYVRSVPLLASSARLIDFIADAQPPEDEPAADAPAPDKTAVGHQGGTENTATLAALEGSGLNADAPPASNGWALGSERSESGKGMLVGNPHFPWIGQLRFAEVQLTVKDGMDIYGAQLIGLPLVGIGFTNGVAWTHTVSAGKRFTAYSMELDPADPTSYLMDGLSVPMDSEEITVEVKDGDSTKEETRTYYSTQFGPVLDFPGVGWTDAATISYRDANIGNDHFTEQYLAMARSESLDDLVAAHEKYQGIPLFNTVAAGESGKVWYADTSATPYLSEEAITAYESRLETDTFTQVAAESNAVLLEGNTSRDIWVDDPEAPWPGVLPWSKLPMTERDDYVMNANDSYWVPNSDGLIDGNFSPLQGLADTARSVRTLQNLAVLNDTSRTGPAGAGGKYGLEELASASVLDGAYLETQWRQGVVESCESASAEVDSSEILDDEDELFLAPKSIDLTDACEALDGWDGHFDVDSSGAVLWREFTRQVEAKELWAKEFSETKPSSTPSGYSDPKAEGEDPVITGLATAVALLEELEIDLDAALGDVQFDARNPEDRIGIPGGLGSDGVTNVVSNGAGSSSTMQEQPETPEPNIDGSTITADGYPISYGTSILLIVEFTEDGPAARSILTYGQVGDTESPEFTTQTRDFAAKQFKTVLFTNEEITGDAGLQEVRASA